MHDDAIFRMVVGHDLEATGDVAMTQAVEHAVRLKNAELHVVYALAVSSSHDMGTDSRRMEDAFAELKRRAQNALGGRKLPVHLHVRFGTPVAAIVQVAVDYDASLVFVGTHGRKGLDRLRNRSVAEELVRTAPLPVLVAHDKDFAGLTRTPRPDEARPGEKLHDERALSDRDFGGSRPSHISGLL